MSWIDSLRDWLGVPKQENISDPRLYDGVSNEAQFGAPEADRLERANPSVPEEDPFVEDTKGGDRTERLIDEIIQEVQARRRQEIDGGVEL